MFNLNSLVDLLREHDLRVMNTFQKSPRQKATCKFVGVPGNVGPWTTDRYSEIDFCLARTRWHNSVLDVKADPFANITSDHKMLKIQLKQRLKAEKAELPPPSLKGVKAKDPQQQSDYQNAAQASILKEENLDMSNIMIIIAEEATALLTRKPPNAKHKDCEDDVV
eukprot:16433226-Heterocapsa_arctica.AAC.1